MHVQFQNKIWLESKKVSYKSYLFDICYIQLIVIQEVNL